MADLDPVEILTKVNIATKHGMALDQLSELGQDQLLDELTELTFTCSACGRDERKWAHEPGTERRDPVVEMLALSRAYVESHFCTEAR